MGEQDNVERAQRGYAAFGAGDAAGAMENIADDIEWITPGNSAISGTVQGKQALGEHWGRLAQKGLKANPQYWFADGDKVVALVQVTIGDETFDSADVMTFRDGKMVKWQSAGDTAAMERIFGSK
jgi:ketosteroid isomerase-like protein